MEVRYEHREKLTLIGYFTEIAPNEGYEKCPEFWQKEYAERFARLFRTGEALSEVEQAVLDNGIGTYSICAEAPCGFTYWIAGEYRGGAVPEGLELYTFPESDWAVFPARGKLPESLQRLNTAVWTEWLPGEGRRFLANGTATLEYYTTGDPESADYESGIMVPVTVLREA
ncbi:MAG: GyrI-like domain-containing protein [Clostridia bacterium]|nr:GyrI-like domain-containing protein [Clostridia bacterium]